MVLVYVARCKEKIISCLSLFFANIVRGFTKLLSLSLHTYSISVTFSTRQALLLLNENAIKSNGSSEILTASLASPLRAIYQF